MTVCANIAAAKVLAWRAEHRGRPAAAAASHRHSFICASCHMELQQCEKELRACQLRALTVGFVGSRFQADLQHVHRAVTGDRG